MAALLGTFSMTEGLGSLVAFKIHMISLGNQTAIISIHFSFVNLPRCICDALRASVRKVAIS